MPNQGNPIVSVVIPTYNHAHFLGRAIQSVIDQTYPYWEMIIIDNHSQDDTEEVVRKFENPKISFFKIHNQGVIARSRNMGIREAGGEWIGFLDSDDCWYPKKLEVIMAAARSHDDCEVICNDEYMIDVTKDTKVISRYGPFQNDFYKVLLLQGNRISTSATVVSREFLTRHDLLFNESEKYVTVEDYGLWLDLAHAGARFSFTHEVLGEYVIHGTNNSSQLLRHAKNSEALLRYHIFEVQQFHSSPERLWKLVFPRLHIEQAKQFVEQRQLFLAIRVGLEVLVKFPIGTMMFLMFCLKRYLRKLL